MKLTTIITIALLTIFLNIACDKKYEIKVVEEVEEEMPINTTFFAGDTDSCVYYNYEPNIIFSIEYMNNGYFEYTRPFDIDLDGINDFALEIKGYRDSSKPESNFWRTISIQSLVNYRLAHSGGFIPLIYGDTLINYSYYFSYYSYSYTYSYNNSYDKKFQFIETGYHYETNSWDTCCGNWNVWGEERYIGFYKHEQNAILGWMRLEFMEDADIIKLKDCAIRKY